MNRKRKQTAILGLVILIIAGGLVLFIGMDVETGYDDAEYEVSGLDMRIAVSKDHTMEVEEFVSVDISKDIRKIGFAIPDGSFKLMDLAVEDEKARAVRKSTGKYVEIKNSQLLTAGHHRYRITYRVIEKPDGNQDKDIFSFDVLPEGWRQPVYKLHALMWFPYGFPLGDIRIDADESPEIKRTIKTEPQSRSFTLGLRGIPEDYSLRVEADLPEGYWQ